MHDLDRLTAAELADPDDTAALDRLVHGWFALAAAADDTLAHWIGLDPEPAPRWRPGSGTLDNAAADAMSWFDEERDALTRAVRQAAGTGQAAIACALAQRMSTYLELTGHYDQWRDVLVLALGAADRAQDRQGQATMLGLLMQVEAIRDDHLSSLRYAALALDAYRLVTTEPGSPPTGSTQPSARLDAARMRGDALAVGLEACQLAVSTRLAGQPADYLSLLEEARDASGSRANHYWSCGPSRTSGSSTADSTGSSMPRGACGEHRSCYARTVSNCWTESRAATSPVSPRPTAGST
jgi:hypothetical protein